MAVTKAKKNEVLAKLNDRFSKAKVVYFSSYSGIQVKKVTALRKQLKKAGVDFMVAKKTLMQIAAKNNGFPEVPADVMAGPVAAVFGYDDIIIPAKTLHGFSKEAEQIALLGGLVDGKVVNKMQAKQLATLPSREELLAKLVGSMKSPISGLHATLSGVLRGFVMVMKGAADKKAQQQ